MIHKAFLIAIFSICSSNWLMSEDVENNNEDKPFGYDVYAEYDRFISFRFGTEDKPIDPRLLELMCANDMEFQIALRPLLADTRNGTYQYMVAESWVKNVTAQTLDRMGISIAKLRGISYGFFDDSLPFSPPGDQRIYSELADILSLGWAQSRLKGLKGKQFADILFNSITNHATVPVSESSLEPLIGQLDVQFRNDFYNLLFSGKIEFSDSAYRRDMKHIIYLILEKPDFNPKKEEIKKLIDTNQVPGLCEIGLSLVKNTDVLWSSTVGELIRSTKWKNSKFGIDIACRTVVYDKEITPDLKRKLFTRLNDQLRKIEAGFPDNQPYEDLDRLGSGQILIETVVETMANDADDATLKMYSRDLLYHTDWLIEQIKKLPLSDEVGPDPSDADGYKFYRDRLIKLSTRIKERIGQ